MKWSDSVVLSYRTNSAHWLYRCRMMQNDSGVIIHHHSVIGRQDVILGGGNGCATTDDIRYRVSDQVMASFQPVDEACIPPLDKPLAEPPSRQPAHDVAQLGISLGHGWTFARFVLDHTAYQRRHEREVRVRLPASGPQYQ